MPSLSIKTKIVLSNCLVLALLISLSLSVVAALNNNSKTVENINSTQYPTLNLASANLVSLKDSFERLNIAVTLGDADILNNNNTDLSNITKNLNEISSHNPNLAPLISKISKSCSEYFANSHELAVKMISGAVDMASATSQAQKNNADFEMLKSQFEALHNDSSDELAGTIDTLVMQNGKIASIILVACLISVLVSGLIAYFLTSSIKNDIQLITDKMKDIASGHGDLTVRIDYEKKDELQNLVTYFNQFVSKLHYNISQIVSTTNSLSLISTNLLAANSDAKTISEKQLSAMQEVSSAVSQMTLAAGDISHNAHDTAKAVGDVMTLSQSGAAAVHHTIESLDLLASDVKKTADVVSELNESTKNAESILLAINSIAEQTNLLALNAAIEAARAGEQGRGFAVVADEVRTLASRTQVSTKEIQSVLENLQSKANFAMGIIQNSLDNAAKCNKNSRDAEATIKDVANSMSDIDQRNELIAAATEEQGQTNKEMESLVHNIQIMSQDAFNSLKQVDDMAQSIESVKGQLLSVSEQFKID